MTNLPSIFTSNYQTSPSSSSRFFSSQRSSLLSNKYPNLLLCLSPPIFPYLAIFPNGFSSSLLIPWWIWISLKVLERVLRRLEALVPSVVSTIFGTMFILGWLRVDMRRPLLIHCFVRTWMHTLIACLQGSFIRYF